MLYLFYRSLLFSLLFSTFLFAKEATLRVNYAQKKEVQHFINHLHQEFKYDKKYLTQLFRKIRKIPKTRSIPSKHKLLRKKKKEGSWEKYLRIHTGKDHINLGIKFMKKHQKTFEKAYKKYGVSAEYITAIIGIESYYGGNRGRYYVFDQLSHLAFGTHRRKEFYKTQLEEFIRMCFREGLEPRRVKGSSSGAIGLAQFMPSNYQHFGIDFNQDGFIRLSNPKDSIGSIANYLKKNGWKKDEPTAIRVTYQGHRFNRLSTGYKHKYQQQALKKIKVSGYFNYTKEVRLIKLEKAKNDELWFGTENFYVITRYNHSSYYAMAVHQLAQNIKWRHYAQSKKRK